MEDDFDISAAVDDIGGGLGFEVDEKPVSDDVVLDVVAKEVSDEKPLELAAPEATATGETPTADPSATPNINEPPKTWRKEASATWAALPSEAKAEILKRETDIFKGIESYKGDATYGKSVRTVVQPYEAIMAANGMDPVATIGGMLRGHHTLATGTPEQKATLFKQMARDYRIDLSSLVAPAGEAPYIDPTVAALQNELRGVQSQLSEANNRRQAEVRASVSADLDKFAADPKNLYFNEVATDIATLLQRGVAGTLQEAYERAVWLNPVTRAKEVARTTAEAATKAAAESATKAAAARKATAANVTTRARSGSATTPTGSLDDTLNEAFAEIKARKG
jgi:hypothetical protein